MTTTVTTVITPMGEDRRTFGVGIEVRDMDESGGKLTLLRGRAVPYGETIDVGPFLERFEPGSLGKSVRESARALPLLTFHDDRQFPVGVAETWDEQRDGLYGEWRISPTDEAQHAATQARDGFMNYLSIRFLAVRSKPMLIADHRPELGSAHKDTIIRHEARLLETSLVSTPAYNNASVEWVRASASTRSGTPQLDAWRDELEKLRG